LRKIIINNKEYTKLLSFYRTHGSINQDYIDIRDEGGDSCHNVFYGRIFHYVLDDKTDTMYFVKEYLSDKHIAKFEYDTANILASYDNVMKVFDIDEGKILCEFIEGIQFSKIKVFHMKQVINVINSVNKFVSELVSKNQHHLIEVNLNNIILNFDEGREMFDYKIIDLESNSERYQEFRNKNLNFLEFLTKIGYDIQRSIHEQKKD